MKKYFFYLLIFLIGASIAYWLLFSSAKLTTLDSEGSFKETTPIEATSSNESSSNVSVPVKASPTSQSSTVDKSKEYDFDGGVRQIIDSDIVGNATVERYRVSVIVDHGGSLKGEIVVRYVVPETPTIKIIAGKTYHFITTYDSRDNEYVAKFIGGFQIDYQ